MKKIVFLDRDGVINKEMGNYVYTIDAFEFNPSVFPFLKSLQDRGYSFIVITNQGGISKGIYQKEDVYKLHKYMQEELEKRGIELLDIFFCPHHDTVERCLCRKPNSLMIEKGLAKYNFSASKAYMIGDSERDYQAAKNAGVKGIKIEPNTNLMKQLDLFE